MSCDNFVKKFVFSTNPLTVGENTFILSLSSEAASEESAELPETTYVQYDAIRFEVA